MTSDELRLLLEDIRKARIAVIGDWCLDVYWFIDMSASEESIETGLDTHPVRHQRYTLGGAGNVASNLAALGVGEIRAYGVIGDDPWGREMLRLLGEIGVNTEGVLVQMRHWDTLAYTKPHIEDNEQNRLDFGNFNTISEEVANCLITALDKDMPDTDVVVINQQVIRGIHSEFIRCGISDLMHKYPEKIFIADSRHFSESFTGACLKLNDHEAARLCGITRSWDERVLREEAIFSAETLYNRLGKPVFVTRGSRGCLVVDSEGMTEISAIQVLGKIDTVGAGDSMLAGIASALAVGRSPSDAAELGNFVATVTIQKLRQTGTATPDEVIAVGSDPDYVYNPELAEDPRRAKIIEGTEIEIVRELSPDVSLTHAIFDHDGTISTLREGWEGIMEPMMVKAVLGPAFDSADESLYLRVVERVRDYIDKSTGIMTLVQMQGLIGIVREFGCVPEAEILDEFGYKQIYNDALMEMVRLRVAKLERGELNVDDFTMKNAPELLRRLRNAGVRLYLASGTDEQDVIDEAKSLGYADLFEGRIYGAVGDVTKDAKKIVLDRILKDIGSGAAGLVTFGDGPVEIRETRKRGGLAIGIASDEVRRYGLNKAKRERLVRAGADMIIPDYSQLDRLLNLLNIS